MLPSRIPSSPPPPSSDRLAGVRRESLAFEDERGEVTLARGLSDTRHDEEPRTLARAPSTHAGEVRRQLELLDARPGPSAIIENDVATPIVDKPIIDKDCATPIIENDVATLTKTAREVDPVTLPRHTPKFVAGRDAADNTAATLVRRDSIPPPSLAPTLAPPEMPTFHARVAETAIRTPLAMVITAPEDNFTRVAPLAAPPVVLHPPRSPIPYPRPAGAHRLTLQRVASAGAGLLFGVMVLAIVAVRPRSTAAPAAQGPETTAVAVPAVEAPPPVSPPVAASPDLAVAAAMTTPATPAASATTPVPAPTMRAQPRHRHAPARAVGRGAPRHPIPHRRAP